MSPLTDTENPNLSNSAASDAISLCTSPQLSAPAWLRANTYADPEDEPPSSSPGAPTTAVSPLTDTEVPNWSASAASGAVSLACWLHTPPLRTNTYADPENEAAFLAPTTTVSPLTDTENPNSSLPAASDAVSLVCWLHTPSLRTNTYADPEIEPASSSPKAPTTAVSPLTDTENPN